MMGKEEYLGRLCNLSKNPEPGIRSIVIEIDKQIVGQEWKTNTTDNGILKGGQS
jgi:hypothetical protein